MPDETDPPPPLRAQLLATEHWSLLASRSTTQAEVLTRINMFLTLVSAGLVSLALVGQAMGFSETFRLFAIVVLVFVCVAGVLTHVRVNNVGEEDLMYVLAMNRLRGAYVDLDAGVAPYLMASPNDDLAGMGRTYFFLGPRSSVSQVAGSSMMFINVVVSMLVGLLAAVIASALGAATWWAVVIGIVVGVLYLLGSTALVGARYVTFWREYRPLFPTPTEHD